ncbi:hypothetical protein FOCC_FOCC012280 [Frankliniella occidentalis]|nr:hypothetical protein FOCC_FOCC012280 [Frankliniella occidentalis]
MDRICPKWGSPGSGPRGRAAGPQLPGAPKEGDLPAAYRGTRLLLLYPAHLLQSAGLDGAGKRGLSCIGHAMLATLQTCKLLPIYTCAYRSHCPAQEPRGQLISRANQDPDVSMRPAVSYAHPLAYFVCFANSIF